MKSLYPDSATINFGLPLKMPNEVNNFLVNYFFKREGYLYLPNATKEGYTSIRGRKYITKGGIGDLADVPAKIINYAIENGYLVVKNESPATFNLKGGVLLGKSIPLFNFYLASAKGGAKVGSRIYESIKGFGDGMLECVELIPTKERRAYYNKYLVKAKGMHASKIISDLFQLGFNEDAIFKFTNNSTGKKSIFFTDVRHWEIRYDFIYDLSEDVKVFKGKDLEVQINKNVIHVDVPSASTAVLNVERSTILDAETLAKNKKLKNDFFKKLRSKGIRMDGKQKLNRAFDDDVEGTLKEMMRSDKVYWRAMMTIATKMAKDGFNLKYLDKNPNYMKFNEVKKAYYSVYHESNNAYDYYQSVMRFIKNANDSIDDDVAGDSNTNHILSFKFRPSFDI